MGNIGICAIRNLDKAKLEPEEINSPLPHRHTSWPLQN